MVTDDLAKRCERQKGCDHRNLVDIHYQDHFGWAGVKVGCYCGRAMFAIAVSSEAIARAVKMAAAAHRRRCAGRPLIATGPSAEIVSIDIRKALLIRAI